MFRCQYDHFQSQIRALQTYYKLKINSLKTLPNSNICTGQKKGIRATFKEIQNRFYQANNCSLSLGCPLCYFLIPFHLKAAQLQRVWEGVRGKKEKEKKPRTNPSHRTVTTAVQGSYSPVFRSKAFKGFYLVLSVGNGEGWWTSCPLFVLILCNHLQFLPVHFTLINQTNT